MKQLLLLALCIGAILGVAKTAAAGPSRALYCMSHDVMRADGTSGQAVDLLYGQPDTDPAYVGALPAVAVEQTIVDSWDPFVYHNVYSLTCDVAATADCVTYVARWWGPYPICAAYVCTCDPLPVVLPVGVVGIPAGPQPPAKHKPAKPHKPTKKR